MNLDQIESTVTAGCKFAEDTIQSAVNQIVLESAGKPYFDVISELHEHRRKMAFAEVSTLERGIWDGVIRALERMYEEQSKTVLVKPKAKEGGTSNGDADHESN